METLRGYVSDDTSHYSIVLSLHVEANILIDRTGCARLVDFGVLTIMSDPPYQLTASSQPQGGTIRWMSPELLEPQEFGFEKCYRTERSDCYALGMVIYEIISGNMPFHEHSDYTVVSKVLKGKRPHLGAEFPDILSEMLRLCWMTQPSDRPDVKDVLQCLERVWESSTPPHSVDGTTTSEEDETVTTEDDEMPTSDEVLVSKEDADGLNFANYSPGKFSCFAYYRVS